MNATKQIQVAMVIGGVICLVAGFVLGGWLWAFLGLVIGWFAGAGAGALGYAGSLSRYSAPC
jgi:hypothetical protein